MPKTQRLMSALFATLVAATVIGVSSPAQAAYPTCDVSGTVYNANGVLTSVPKAQAAGTTSCNLRRGNHSNAVRILQVSLNFCYKYAPFYPLQVDSDYGPLTEAAVKWVQAHPGLNSPVTADGIYGPATRDAINWRPQNDDIYGCVALV